MGSYKICDYCGEYEHDCKCLAAKRIAKLKKQLSSQTADVKLIVEALKRVWDEDECGWLNDGITRECVKCGAKSSQIVTSPSDTTRDDMTHAPDCTQGFIAEALSCHTAQKCIAKINEQE